MGDLNVDVECLGRMLPVGKLIRSGGGRARFCYREDYLAMDGAVPVSVSLPLQKKPFDEEKTKIFFEGLLPEGFTRRSVAAGLRVNENDYISILAALGNECLGALRVTDEEGESIPAAYELLDDEQVRELAGEGATQAANIVVKCHLSLTGASGKVGLYYDRDSGRWYLPRGMATSTHIVKQSHVRLENIVVNEQLSLRTAEKLGIDTPDSFIINTGSGTDGEILFATERYDRRIDKNQELVDGLPRPFRLHQEDFAQAMGIASASKYESPKGEYLERIFDIIRSRSSEPLTDMLKMWDYLVYDYLIGNTDNHIKNLSLLYSEDLKQLRLAPLYDVISTVVYDRSTRDMSVSIDGRYSIDEIDEKAFINQAEKVHLGKKAAKAHFQKLQNGFEKALNEAACELKDEGFSNAPDIRDRILERSGALK